MSPSVRFKNYLRYVWSNRNYRLSFYMLFVTLLWLSTGLLKAEHHVAEVEQAAPRIISVQGLQLQAQAYQPSVFVRGRTEADKNISLRSELAGQVVAMPAKEGRLVKKGEVICQMALEDRSLRLQEAQSMVDRAQIEYDGSLKLSSSGYQSRTAIPNSKANLASAKANLKRRELDLANVKVRAPFSGLVDAHMVDAGDYLKKGDACATLLDLDPLIVSGRVSEDEVIRLRLDTSAAVTLLTGEQLSGQLSYIGYDSDSVTRTYRIEVKVANPNSRLRSGLTAAVVLPVEDLLAYNISSSILTLDDSGQLAVKIVDDSNRAQLYVVNIVGDSSDGIWVTGLPDSIVLITRGQEYVSSGQEVAVTLVNQPEIQGLVGEIVTPVVEDAADVEATPAIKEVNATL